MPGNVRDITIDLIRHGEPVGGRRYRGHGIDDPLSETGWAQMWEAIGEAAPWDRIVSSPLQRCRAFAEALASRQGIPVTLEPRFSEIGFGSWEVRGPAEIQASNRAEYEAFHTDPVNRRPPGAEPLDGFIMRVVTAYTAVLRNPGGQHCLIVAHAGVIRAIIAHVLQASPVSLYRIKVDNAGVTRIRHGRYGGKLEFHNVALPRRAAEPPKILC
jgi:alpha-ribazole phosphatase